LRPAASFALIAVAAAFQGSIPAAAAQTPPRTLGESGISVEPAVGVSVSLWLVYEIDPGSAVADDVIVANDSDIARELDIYTADAHTTADGAFVAELQQTKRQNVGAWTRLDTSHLSLQPHTRARVHLDLAVPAGTEPGEYEGSVLAQFTSSTDKQVQIVHRIGLRIYLTVRGALTEAGHIDSVSAGHWWQRGWPGDPVNLETNFVNTGNVHLKLTGKVHAGSRSQPLTQGGLYAVVPRGSPLRIATSLSGHPWFGFERIAVDADYTNHASGHSSGSTYAWYFPWKLVLLVLAIAVLAGYVGRRVWRRLRRPGLAVSLGGVSMRMTVVDPEEHPAGMPTVADGEQMVVVALRVANAGDQPFPFSAAQFQLIDRENHAFASDPAARAALDDPGDREVPPGDSDTFVLGFKLPATAHAQAAVYRAGGSSLLVERVGWRR
jgi:hypothetical protein